MELKKDAPVLLIDDSPEFVELVRRILQREGIEEIISAGDGMEAISTMETVHKLGKDIQFILLDWNMPNLTGPQFIKIVREDDLFKNIPIIMVTAKKNPEDIDRAKNVGANNFIVKPTTPKEIIRKIKETLKACGE